MAVLTSMRFYVDVSQKRFVRSFTNGGDASFQPLIENDYQPIEIILLRTNPAGGLLSPFAEISNTGLLVRAGVGTPGSPSSTILSYVSLTPETVSNPDWNPTASTGVKWTGILNLTGLNAILAGLDSNTTTFEVELKTTTDGTNTGNIIEENTIQADISVIPDLLKQAGTIAVLQTPTFYTAQETGTLFLRKNAVDRITGVTEWDVVVNGSLTVKSVVGSGTLPFTFDDNPYSGIARRGDVVLATGLNSTGTIFDTQDYVTAHIASPGTLTGPLYLSRDPLANNEAATKAYVLANSGTQPISNGLIRSGGYLQVDFGQTGTQVPKGNHTHTTGTLVESTTALFFTEARTRATPLTGLDPDTQGEVTAYDTVLTSIGKLEATKVSCSSGSFTQPAIFQPGSASAPGIAFSQDTDTGVFSPAADQVAITINSTEVARFLSNVVSVGLTTALAKLGVKGNGSEVILALKQGAGQSVDSFQILDSSGNVLYNVNNVGGVEISNSGLAGTEPTGLQIQSTDAAGESKIN